MNTTLRFLVLFLLVGATTFAQFPQNRTTQTIIADALAVLPAENQTAYKQAIGSLVSTGEEGLTALIKSLDAPYSTATTPLEFAISGWTNYAATNKEQRQLAAKTIAKALPGVQQTHAKRLLIRQLELLGEESTVGVLSTFLTDDAMVSPAAQALANIGNTSAVTALTNALTNNASRQAKLVLINALGQTGNQQAEVALLEELNKNKDKEIASALYPALAETGTLASARTLQKEAWRTRLSDRESNATTSYVQLLHRLAKEQPEDIRRDAERLLRQANRRKQPHMRIAATNLLMQVPSTDKDKMMRSALKDADPAFTASVINNYNQHASPEGITTILNSIERSRTEAHAVIMINWLGSQQAEEAIPLLISLIENKSPIIQKAAIHTLLVYNNDQITRPIVNLLYSTDNTMQQLAYEALASYKRDFSTELVAEYETLPVEGKVNALNLIGLRKMASYFPMVAKEMQTASSPTVRQAAAQNLQQLSTGAELGKLFDWLEQDNQPFSREIQAAINKVLSTMSNDEQLETITQRMKQSSKPHLYYGSLAANGSRAALAKLKEGHQAGGVRAQAAFNALLSMQSFEAIYTLLDIARSSTNQEDINKATNAIVTITTRSNQTGIVKANYLQEAMKLASTTQQKRQILRHLGNTGSFQALVFIEQFLDNSELSESAAQAGMSIALSNPQFAGTTTRRILEKIHQVLNNPDAGYQRQAIQKYLTDTKDYNGFEPLFNGKDLTGWKGLVGNPISRARMSADQLAIAQEKADKQAAESWVVENGEMLFTGKGDNLCTVKEYGDFEMLVDWKLLPGPEPDAGIYLRGSPQVQIWDTSLVHVGAQVGSGGLYNNQLNRSTPLKIADQRVGEWNTFHIIMKGERVTVYLNGELVTDNVILENFWNRRQPIFPEGYIELQAHGSKVKYRNIYIREFERPEPFTLTEEEKKEGFEVLFDGISLDKWSSNKTDYIVENGAIVLYPTTTYGGNLFTKEEYSDFIFRFKFKLTPGANNGLGIRTPKEGDPAYVGMELQILDDDAPIYANLSDYQYHGSVYGIIPARRGALKPVGEWNYQEVIADGDNIKITLNGTVIVDGNLREASKNGTIDGLDHPGMFNKSGYIGFLGHGSEVHFKDIRIKRLNK
jgi:HEAT repeat protein